MSFRVSTSNVGPREDIHGNQVMVDSTLPECPSADPQCGKCTGCTNSVGTFIRFSCRDRDSLLRKK